MKLFEIQKQKTEENNITDSELALQVILNYELQDSELVEFICAIEKLADIEAKYARYILVTVSDLEKMFKNKKKIQPYIYELMLLGGIINKGKDTCLIQNEASLEPGYLFDKNVIDKLLINAVNKIKGDGKISKYISYFRSVVAHQCVYRSELGEMPYRAFLNTTYYQIIKEIVAHDWGYECALCTSKKNIQVHHRTYVHRGSEHLYIKDLILLCAECHCRQHGK